MSTEAIKKNMEILPEQVVEEEKVTATKTKSENKLNFSSGIFDTKSQMSIK